MSAIAKPISPLRQRMIEDMRLRKLGEKTQSGYIRGVKNFTRYLGRSPDTAAAECRVSPRGTRREHPMPPGLRDWRQPSLCRGRHGAPHS